MAQGKFDLRHRALAATTSHPKYMQQLENNIAFTTAFTTYVADSILGEGGSGRVYGGIDESGRQVAIMALSPERVTRDKLKRFQNEYRFCSTCEHPNILRT